MPGPRQLGPRPKLKKGIFGRLIKTIFGYYPVHLTVVAVCLLISAVSSISMSVFMQRLIDDSIIPGLKEGWEAVAAKVLGTIALLACIYAIGVLCSFIYTRIMAIVCQGTLKRFRDSMFDKMQTLPIKYFDTHAHGDIMSTYTNDADAVRQIIGQSMPSLFSSIISIFGLVVVMLSYSLWLFLLVMVALFIIGKAGAYFGGKSGKYMVGRQKSLAKEEGFIEEMMTGLKVVKVFTHEQEAKDDFDRLNAQLFDDSMLADKNGNVLGPITNNVGNIFYVVLAVFGSVLFSLNAVNICFRGVVPHIEPLTLGMVVTFLGMFRQLSQMVGQISQQITMVMMGLAGASRIFDLIDETPEEDHGYCELVNVKRGKNGELVETDEKTNLWAWKHPH